jgi:hypothetical protein
LPFTAAIWNAGGPGWLNAELRGPAH